MNFDLNIIKPKDYSITYDEATNIISVPELYENKTKGMGHEFFLNMRKNQYRVAQIISDTGEQDTFGSLLQRCVRTALHLQTKQFNKDDIVCVCSYNQLNSCVPLIASQFLGLKVASLDPSFNVADAAHLINIVKPKIFFISSNSIDLIEEATRKVEVTAEIVIFGNGYGDNYTEFDSFLEENDEEENFTPVEIDDLYATAMIFFSSGTTGLPKGICMNHYGLLGQGMTMICWYVKAVNLSYASTYWISAVFILIGTILTGTSKLLCSKFDPHELWKIIDKYKVNFLFLAPYQALEMIKAGHPEYIDTTSLLNLVTGGGHILVKQLKALGDLLPGTLISQAYGQTEIQGVLTVYNVFQERDRLYLKKKPSSCGRAVPGLTYKVVDPVTEQTCGPNIQGELRVKTKYVMNGYFNLDSSDSFDSEGWLKTGDIVYFDEDLCFFVVDRIKEMLKYKSWHVAPAALEQVLHSHPAVKRAVIIGIPDEEDGDHPMALVELHPELKNDVSPEELENFVAERVHERQKLRAGVKFVEEFLLTPTGKIKRNELRRMILNEMSGA